MAAPLVAFHPANTLTYASLIAGMSALVSAVNGSAAGAGACVALAVICDTFDGCFARRFNRTPAQREIGVQLDSLADATVFGAVPVICAWLLTDRGWVSIGAGLLYAACAITRLAFYNVTQADRTGFVGVPVPVAALIWSTLLLVHPETLLSAGVTMAVAIAMVLPLPVPRPHGIALAAFACWPVVVILGHALTTR